MCSMRLAGMVVASTAIAAMAGCSTASYVVRPAERADAVVAGRPAAYYAIPPTSPKGDVRVASFGVVDLRSQTGGNATIHALAVRLVVANNNDGGAWSFDTQEQYASVPGREAIRPAFVNTDAPDRPSATIPAGGKQTFDLYFPLPEGVEDLGKIPEFDVFWQVTTPEGRVAERTPFERLRVEPAPSPGVYAFGPGYGPYWWYDPFWPPVTFARPWHYWGPRPWYGPRFGPPHHR